MARPRIVILDAYTLNPGDLSWSDLASLGSVEVHERTTPGDVVARAAGAPIVLTNKVMLNAEVLGALPELRYVGVLATGSNVVDRGAARARGVVVTNVPEYGADSVAEHTLSLMLEAQKQLSLHARAVRDGSWACQPDFSLRLSPIRLLAGKTLGIIGFGAIGRRVGELALAFKMRVLVAQRSSLVIDPTTGVSAVPLDELFRRSDIVTLHCPLTPETAALVNTKTLSAMKPEAILVNTARGGLIDEAALSLALERRALGGAYLDVLSVEPPARDHVLVSLPNCWITPHVAWASREARQRLLEIATANVRAFLAGSPTNVVS
jgi:glycerate dehydrogenase